MRPKVGEKVTIVMPNYSPCLTMPSLWPNEPKTKTFKGTVVPNDSWLYREGEFITITNEGNPSWPFRMIALAHVISINGKKVAKAAERSEYPKVIPVKGSKGADHKVTLFGDGTARCTCISFQVRKYCRHSKDELQKDLKRVRRSS